jgi:hypothetical protein
VVRVILLVEAAGIEPASAIMCNKSLSLLY